MMNNNDEMYLNDVVMEDEIIEEFGMQQSLQTKENVNVDEGKEKLKEILKILHFQRKKWKEDSRNALCWSFYCVNDNKSMDVKCFQLMKCIFYYASSILIKNSKTQARKGLILYIIANGITTLTKTCLCIPLYNCKNI